MIVMATGPCVKRLQNMNFEIRFWKVYGKDEKKKQHNNTYLHYHRLLLIYVCYCLVTPPGMSVLADWRYEPITYLLLLLRRTTHSFKCIINNAPINNQNEHHSASIHHHKKKEKKKKSTQF